MNRLIDLQLVHQLNEEHRHIDKDIREGFAGEPLLQDILLQQVRKAEDDVRRALDKLMNKYIHAMEAALVTRPSPELDELLATLPQITTEGNG